MREESLGFFLHVCLHFSDKMENLQMVFSIAFAKGSKLGPARRVVTFFHITLVPSYATVVAQVIPVGTTLIMEDHPYLLLL